MFWRLCKSFDMHCGWKFYMKKGYPSTAKQAASWFELLSMLSEVWKSSSGTRTSKKKSQYGLIRSHLSYLWTHETFHRGKLVHMLKPRKWNMSSDSSWPKLRIVFHKQGDQASQPILFRLMISVDSACSSFVASFLFLFSSLILLSVTFSMSKTFEFWKTQ